MTIYINNKVDMSCNTCGIIETFSHPLEDARKKFRERGWRVVKTTEPFTHQCQDCAGTRPKIRESLMEGL